MTHETPRVTYALNAMVLKVMMRLTKRKFSSVICELKIKHQPYGDAGEYHPSRIALRPLVIELSLSVMFVSFIYNVENKSNSYESPSQRSKKKQTKNKRKRKKW